jgi:CBS domain-containing protein
MSDAITRSVQREVEPLSADEPVAEATRKLIELGLPGLPAVENDGSFAGIFGEREFMKALFPGYVGELASTAMISRTIDESIERRLGCRAEPIREHLTTDHVVVGDDHSDTQLAELFLHHRILVIPIATDGRIHAVVTRSAFFRALAERLEESAEHQRPD